VTHTEFDAVVLTFPSLLLTQSGSDAVDLIAAATSFSAAFWQVATPRLKVASFSRSDPRLSCGVVHVEARRHQLLSALIKGLLANGP
jgi:hypothetical protein